MDLWDVKIDGDSVIIAHNKLKKWYANHQKDC